MALLLCSRNEAVRKKWYRALHPQFQVHQVGSLAELLSQLKSLRVELVLLHRNMIDSEQLRQIMAQCAGCKVFVFSDRPDDQEGVACLHLGCVGYANTYIAPTRLVTAVEAVQSGLVWVGTSLMHHLIRSVSAIAAAAEPQEDARQQPASGPLSLLSRREYQIARLVAEGLQNGEIASQLEITERTVKSHLSSIFAKTKTRGRLNLALLMQRS